jgi:hypothetical protein
MSGVVAHHQVEIARFDRAVTQTLATVTRIAANVDRYASWLSA